MYFSSFGYRTYSTSCDNCGIDAVSNQLLTSHPRYCTLSPISGFRLPQSPNLCTGSFHHSSLAIHHPMDAKTWASTSGETHNPALTNRCIDSIAPSLCDDTCFIHLHHNTRTPDTHQPRHPCSNPRHLIIRKKIPYPRLTPPYRTERLFSVSATLLTVLTRKRL